jgi:hypothetical protein
MARNLKHKELLELYDWVAPLADAQDINLDLEVELEDSKKPKENILAFELNHQTGTSRSALLKRLLTMNVWVMSRGRNNGRKIYIISKDRMKWKVGREPK